MKNPFRKLNLWRNPFGELTSKEWMDAATPEASFSFGNFGKPGHALQLLAPKGRGKTTHLLALAKQFPEAIFHRATRGPMPETGPLLLLDEADSLWFWQRAKAFRTFPSVAFTTHRNLAYELHILGYQVQTASVQLQDREHLSKLVNRRIDRARTDTGPVPRVDAPLLDHLQARHGDDIRALFDDLYDHFQILARS